MFVIVLFVITLFCLIPLAIALIYLVMGVKSLTAGVRDKNESKRTGAITAIIISLLGTVGSILLWYFLCRTLLSWEL